MGRLSQEKYPSPPVLVAVSQGRPASLLDLPVELLRMITRELSEKEGLALRAVCYRLLDGLSTDLQSVCMDCNDLLVYLRSRVSRRLAVSCLLRWSSHHLALIPVL
jgi:hypothetical protein